MSTSNGSNYGSIRSDGVKKNEKKIVKRWLALLITGASLAAFGAIMFPLVNYVIRDQIEQKVIISNTSETYDVWQDNPVPIYMQFYLFNVENEEEVLAGGKPSVSQHGPYTYRERRFKFDIVWNPNGTVSYRQNKTFIFVPEMSNGKESDLIKTVNPLMSTVVQAIKWIPESVRSIISLVISASGADGLFMTRPVHEILWGYEDSTLTLLNKFIPLWFFSTNIGYFTHRNYTDDGLYTVYTGSNGVTKLGNIDKYNGLTHLDLWSTRWANQVNGSDGSVGPPFQFDNLLQSVYISQLCRSIIGNYEKIVSSPQGIPLRRFTGNKFTLANDTDNPDNIGFCTPQSKCLPAGLLNSTLCQDLVDYFHVPAILSFPHYLYADPSVQNSVWGMSPHKEEHETAIDVEPWTGMILRVASRLQVNFFIEKVADIRQTANVRTLYFPVFWLNETAETDKSHEDLLLNQLFIPMTIMKAVKITFLTLGTLMCIISIFILARQAREETMPLSSYGKGENKIARPTVSVSPTNSQDSLTHLVTTGSPIPRITNSSLNELNGTAHGV